MKRKIILGRPLTSIPTDTNKEIIIDLDGHNKEIKKAIDQTNVNIDEIINKVKSLNSNQ